MVAVSRYAFYLDGRTCSGCKACQVACKDKHGLPPGVSWRRVYEVTGGGWNKDGPAWASNVFAYYLSVGCNHCDEPVCIEVCPARAITQRSDGIVLIDSDHCIGCKYCAWACPYDAPQYDQAHGRMGKCTFCVDELDAGRAPTCVAACPVRVLDYGTPEELQARYNASPIEYPFADVKSTGPALLLTPHAAAGRRPARIANEPEVSRVAMNEHSLVAFTLCAQAAVGAFWLAMVVEAVLGFANPLARLLVPVLMLVAVAASLVHLGQPLRAWRAVTNLRTSWLSREIVFTVAFTVASLVSAWQSETPALTGLTALLGAGLLYNMARVYQLRTIPPWDRWSTLARFATSAALLGSGLYGLSLVAQGALVGIPALAFAVAFAIILSGEVRGRLAFYRARLKRRTA